MAGLVLIMFNLLYLTKHHLPSKTKFSPFILRTLSTDTSFVYSIDGSGSKQPTTEPGLFSLTSIGYVESPYLQKFGTPKQATIARKVQVPKNNNVVINVDNKRTSLNQDEFLKSREAASHNIGSSTEEPQDVIGVLHIFPEYKDCLDDLDQFEYIWLISMMHLNSGFKTRVKIHPIPTIPIPIATSTCEEAQIDNQTSAATVAVAGTTKSFNVGLFASRAPHRPNPIALSALKLVRIDKAACCIHVQGLDLLNGTPILDIKPYVPAFDSFPESSAGWMGALQGDATVSRVTGYQDIKSARGVKDARKKKENNKIDINNMPEGNDII